MGQPAISLRPKASDGLWCKSTLPMSLIPEHERNQIVVVDRFGLPTDQSFNNPRTIHEQWTNNLRTIRLNVSAIDV